MRVNDRYLSFYYEADNEMGEIAMDPAKTALLIVDMQPVFVRRPQIENPTEFDKKEAIRWEPFYKKVEEVVIPNNQRLLAAFREKGLPVFFCRIISQKKDGSDRSLDQKGTGYNALHLLENDPAGQVIEELAPQEDEVVIRKTTDSALTGSNLRLMLHNMGIDTVVVTGVLTDQCVSGTVRSLADESYKVWLIEDGCMAATQEIQDHELTVLNNIYCHVINTDECLAAL